MHDLDPGGPNVAEGDVTRLSMDADGARALDLPWPADGRPGRARLRGFLRAQASGSHAMLLGGARVSAVAVVEDVAVLSRALGRPLLVVGRPPLRAVAHARGASFLPESALARPITLPDRLRRELARAGRPGRGAVVLLAPGAARIPALAAADAVLDGSDDGLFAGRFCLVPRGGLQRHGPPGALSLAQRHPVSLVLP